MAEFPSRNGMWRNPLMIFLGGQIIMFVFWVGGASYFSGQFTQRFANLETRVVTSETLLHRMDDNGTNASRMGIMIDNNRLNDIDARLKYYEELSRRLPVIEAAIVRVEADVKEIKASKK